jgi:hypothetical protein
MLEGSKYFAEVADCIMASGNTVYKATKYIDERMTLKATRKRFGGKIPKNERRIEILFTIGTPNYEERQFIKLLKKSGEPFPVKNVQLKHIRSIK